jgi:hypothetical protein
MTILSSPHNHLVTSAGELRDLVTISSPQQASSETS